MKVIRRGFLEGVILTAQVSQPTTKEQKAVLENKLKDYAHKIYTGGIHIYSEINNDTPSIAVFEDIITFKQSLIDI